MTFFNSVKRKINMRNIFSAIIYLIIVCVVIWEVFCIGFSNDINWKFMIGAIGVPVPDWFVCGICIVVGTVCLFKCLKFIKLIIRNSEFNSLMVSVKKIGNADDIGDLLLSLPKNPYTKGGELKYNNQVLFYIKGTYVKIINPAFIKSIHPEYSYNDGYNVGLLFENDSLKIKTNKKSIMLLAEDISKLYGKPIVN